MVQAILAGRKTQTRRVMKHYVTDCAFFCEDGAGDWIGWSDYHDSLPEFTKRAYPNGGGLKCPYGKPGDELWVREAFMELHPLMDDKYNYRADSKMPDAFKWKPSIFMPRWASRITLQITAVRVERVQDISDKDALAEGVDRTNTSIPGYARTRFQKLWDSINAQRGHSWESNPFVWVIEFVEKEPEKFSGVGGNAGDAPPVWISVTNSINLHANPGKGTDA